MPISLSSSNDSNFAITKTEPPILEGDFAVHGRHAHAWPEIGLDRYGWSPFEPTPGRGLPGAVGYAGVPTQQASLPESD